MAATDTASGVRPLERLRGRPLPVEGEGGLFSEGWYPVCLAEEVPDDGIHGAPFLGGRVIVFRAQDRSIRVLSAYCMHVGADLAAGEKTAAGVRCGFHGWEYDGEGRCVALASGDPLPPRAKLYRFHAQEKFGIVFAHNGEEPLYELPSFPHPDDEIVVRAGSLPDLFPVDPWVISANTPDLLHITELHKFEMLNDAYEAATWSDYAASFPVHARLPTGQDFDVVATIHGTNYFFQTGTMDGRWFGWAAPLGIPVAGFTKLFTIFAAKPLEGESPEDTEAFIDYVSGVELAIAAEDMPIFAGLHYTPGNLTRGDRVLARFFEYLRNYPRSCPSADFIN